MRRQVFNSLTDCFNLPNGVRIPCVGFGTYKTPDGAACVESVLTALGAGYRHIDTAEFYFNEESVGRAIAESGVPRDEIFVTTKVWNTHQGYDATLAAFDESAKNWGWTPSTSTSSIGRLRKISKPNTPPPSLRRGAPSKNFTQRGVCAQSGFVTA